jgi:class 3 adenylate cyclase
VNIGARVADAAKAGQTLVSDEACARLDAERLDLGRGKRLKASGAPRDLRVHAVRRA